MAPRQRGAIRAPAGTDPWVVDALRAGDLGRRGPGGMTPPHAACCMRRPGGRQLLERLIAASAPLGARDDAGCTPAHLAAAGGRAAALAALARAGAPLGGRTGGRGLTPAHVAAAQGHAAALLVLSGGRRSGRAQRQRKYTC